MAENKTNEGPLWEVSGGCIGTNFTDYLYTTDDLLDLSARLLYANSLFEILLLRIQHMYSGHPKMEWDGKCLALRKDTVWVMMISDSPGKFRQRQFSNKHDLFGMLIYELRRGKPGIEIRHISNVGTPEEWEENL
jgi:hypothetical protein